MAVVVRGAKRPRVGRRGFAGGRGGSRLQQGLEAATTDEHATSAFGAVSTASFQTEQRHEAESADVVELVVVVMPIQLGGRRDRRGRSMGGEVRAGLVAAVPVDSERTRPRVPRQIVSASAGVRRGEVRLGQVAVALSQRRDAGRLVGPCGVGTRVGPLRQRRRAAAGNRLAAVSPGRRRRSAVALPHAAAAAELRGYRAVVSRGRAPVALTGRLLEPERRHRAPVLGQYAHREDVRDHHDDQRDVEGEDRAVEDEVFDGGNALSVDVDVGVVGESGNAERAADRSRHDPDERDLEPDAGPRATASVADGVAQRAVAVQGHGTHVPDGGGTQQNVHCRPDHADTRLQREIT